MVVSAGVVGVGLNSWVLWWAELLVGCWPLCWPLCWPVCWPLCWPICWPLAVCPLSVLCLVVWGVLGVVVGDREAVACAGTHNRIKQTRRDRARQLAGESGCNVVGENSERFAGQRFGHAVYLVALGLVPHQLEGLRSRLVVATCGGNGAGCQCVVCTWRPHGCWQG